jgi:formylglycine-generating enzyme required for sulfatase activity
MRFCIDRYEFPNIKGIRPITAVNWEEAAAGCARVGKRLCKDHEWTLACEGPERLPYPYGFSRSSQACNIDRPFVKPDNDKINDPYERAEEIERLDRREPSGSRAQCMSPYGVADMTGNVDEWVVNEEGKVNDKPYKSGLKGGWWGPVRNRCRPMTTDHNQWHMGFAIGYRCCADAK